jgi:hypothetical protein
MRGLLMVVAVFRVPSCMAINFRMLDSMQTNGLIDYYEVRNYNTEIIVYWREFNAAETKSIDLDFVQIYSGQCY